MTNIPRKISQKLIIKNGLSSKPDLKTLKKLIENSGFTLVEYNRYNNSDDVNALIKKLNIENILAAQNSFVYISGNIRLVFLNIDLTDSDKAIVLCHELGHIWDQHIEVPNHLYSKVERENYANEFAHYLRHPSLMTKIVSTFLRHKLACILVLSLMTASIPAVCISHNSHTTDMALQNTISASETYYVTSSGQKYHKGFCKHVKYRTNTSQLLLSEAKSKGYTPCLDCIGESNPHL